MKYSLFLILILSIILISGCGSQKIVEDTVKDTADAVQEAAKQVAEEITDVREEISEPVSEIVVEEEIVPEQEIDKEIITTKSSSVKEIEMTARRWEFEPSVITVKEGERLRLIIKSRDLDVTHGFSISAFNINRNLEPGKEEIIEFVANKKGSFTFACSVFCGSGHGSMKGKLIVE